MAVTVLLLAGCGSRHTSPAVVIQSNSETRISTSAIESEREWSSTYGAARPKLQHVISLGTIDMPASSHSHSAAPPSPEPSSVVVHVENQTTQSVVVLPARNVHPVKRVARKHLPDPRTHPARVEHPGPKTRAPQGTSTAKEEQARRKKMQPTGHAPLALFGSISDP